MPALAARTVLALALAAALPLLSSCTARPIPAPVPATPQKLGTVVFDMGHSEIFSPTDPSPLGQSQAVARIESAGFEVEVTRERLTSDTLKDASGLILAGPMSPLIKEEYDAITSFVERGGTVLLTIHVPFPVFAVPAHWGLPVQPFVIQSERPVAGQNDAGVLIADGIVRNQLTQGVNGVFVLSGWPVSAAGEDAEIVVGTGAGGWLDRDRDGSRDTTEGADLGVVGVTKLGKGYVVVSGDDAVFANVAIGEADNAVLLDNIMRLFARARDV